MKLLLSLCIITLSFISFGQNQSAEIRNKRDSLKLIFTNSSNTDSTIVEAYKRITISYRGISRDSSIFYLEEMKNYSDKNKSYNGYYEYYSLKARIYKKINPTFSFDTLEIYLNKAVDNAKKLESRSVLKQVNTYYNLSYDFLRFRKLDKALLYAEKANNLAVKSKDTRSMERSSMIMGAYHFYGSLKYDSSLYYLNIADSLINKYHKNHIDLGTTYSLKGHVLISMKYNKESLEYFYKAKEIFEREKSESDLNYIKLVLGRAEYMNKNYLNAIQINLECLDHFKETKSNVRIIESCIILTKIYRDTKIFEKGLAYSDTAIQVSILSKDSIRMIRSMKEKAIVLWEMGKFNQSLSLSKQGYDLVNKFGGIYEKRDLVQVMISCQESLGNYKESYELLNEYHALNDSMEALNQNNVTQELETKYQSEKKEREIELLTAESELDSQKQKSQTRTLIGGIILTSLAGIFLFLLYRNRQKTNKKLQEVDSIKTRFFENISHEFRTPLTLIKLPVSNALKTKGSLSSKQLSSIHNNTSRLQNLVEDLLSLSELDAGKMIVNKTESEPFKQSKILCSQFDSYASSKGISYTKIIEDKHIIASYDSSVLDKIITNLISNAIKYSRPGDNVTTSISYHSNNFKIKVKDNGLGISKENQHKIFDRFYQIGNKDESIQGSGIGLALVKRILELNKGSIEVESKLNEGSLFTVNLPLEKVHEIIQVEPEEQFIEINEPIIIEKEDLVEQIELGNKPQLLITEDNLELLEYISGLFQNEFQILTAQNGKEGLKKATEFVPDFIISDWMMPEMNGIVFCEQIKTNPITSHIPFLLLTAKSDVKDKIKGYENGADAYFSKPFNIDELKAQIHNIINQRKILFEKYSDGNIPTLVSANSHDTAFWEDFKTHLKNNLSESELSAETIAKEFHMSRMQLHRKTTALTGQTVSALIRNQRMKLAVQLLNESKFRISEICFEVGYYDNSSFTRTFKKEYGVTPTQYRNKDKK